MNKAYARINWENHPSDNTPLNERNLNKLDAATDEIDNRVVALDATKLDKVTAATMVKDVSYNESTGIFTITYLNGATIILDTKLEKLAVNFSFNKEAQKLIIVLDDGTKQEVDLSALITEYEFSSTDTIAFSVDSTGKVSAIVKDGSITEGKLQPNFLADIKVEVAKAQASASAAANSEANAEFYASIAESEADAAKTSEQNAKASEIAAAGSESTAATKASAAATSATEASNCATEAESYAHGGTGTRVSEDSDNAKYYYEQTKQISQSLNGIIPQGTVAFTDLPTSGMQYGDMYNISDAFTSDERFNDGGGVYYGAGNNVIWVSGDKWDVTAGSGVTGVKGNRETTYRQGNVNITPANIGALPEDGNAVSATKAMQDGNGNVIVDVYQTKTGNTNNNSTTFASADSTSPTAWTDVSVLASGEKHSSLFNKISTMFKNVRWLYKMLGTTDISAIGGGTVTGALSAINTDLTNTKTDLQCMKPTTNKNTYFDVNGIAYETIVVSYVNGVATVNLTYTPASQYLLQITPTNNDGKSILSSALISPSAKTVTLRLTSNDTGNVRYCISYPHV